MVWRGAWCRLVGGPVDARCCSTAQSLKEYRTVKFPLQETPMRFSARCVSHFRIETSRRVTTRFENAERGRLRTDNSGDRGSGFVVAVPWLYLLGVHRRVMGCAPATLRPSPVDRGALQRLRVCSMEHGRATTFKTTSTRKHHRLQSRITDRPWWKNVCYILCGKLLVIVRQVTMR